MDAGQNDLSSLKSGINMQAAAYYRGLCDAHGQPGRQHVRPEDMVPFLSHVILIDVLRDPLDFRYRVVGSYYWEFWQSNPTGKRMSEVPGQGPGSRIWQRLEGVVRNKRPVSTDIPYVGPKRNIFTAEDCVMPLAGDGVHVDMIMVTCEYLSRIEE